MYVKAPKIQGNILIVTVSGDSPSTPVFLGRMSASAKSLSSFVILNVAFQFSRSERRGKHSIFQCIIKRIWQSLASLLLSYCRSREEVSEGS